jgi:hypothetical protein
MALYKSENINSDPDAILYSNTCSPANPGGEPMPGEVTALGGARIGWLNATWPSARLKVSRTSLTLKVLIFGTYQFSPENVVSFEKYGPIPILWQGIRIHHNIQGYPARIVFWCLGSTDRLISRIRETGFVGSGRAHHPQKRSGFPVKWQPLLLMIVLWNILFLVDEKYRGEKEVGPGVLLALLLFTVVPLGIRHYRPLQKIFLKEGRDPREIGAWLNFLPVLCGGLFLATLLGFLAGNG